MSSVDSYPSLYQHRHGNSNTVFLTSAKYQIGTKDIQKFHSFSSVGSWSYLRLILKNGRTDYLVILDTENGYFYCKKKIKYTAQNACFFTSDLPVPLPDHSCIVPGLPVCPLNDAFTILLFFDY